MQRLSALSNPTGLLDLDKHRVTIAIDDSGKRPEFSLARLDIADLALPYDARVVVIARRGNAEERIELGPLASWNKGFVPLIELPDEGTWLFRVLIVHGGSAKLAAAAENIRPKGAADSESFIALEAADLGECPWEILLLEQDGRVAIRFNRQVYNSAAEASADQFFIAMLLPEAVRRLTAHLAAHPACLVEEPWKPVQDWLTHMRVAEIPDDENQTALTEWQDSVLAAFCERFGFASRLRELRQGEDEE